MDDMLVVILMRALERLTVLFGGILAIWIGYKLFALVPLHRDSEGKIDLPGGISIFVTRVGPGVFFALFGTGLMAYSASKPVAYSIEARGDASGANLVTSYTGFSGGTQNSANATEGVGVPPGSPPREDIIKYLNVWLSETPDNADGNAKNNRRIAVREAKLALMRENWVVNNWGVYSFFHKWAIEKGDTADTTGLPAANQGAVEVFQRGAK